MWGPDCKLGFVKRCQVGPQIPLHGLVYGFSVCLFEFSHRTNGLINIFFFLE